MLHTNTPWQENLKSFRGDSNYIRKNATTLMKDDFLLVDLKLEVCQEWVLFL